MRKLRENSAVINKESENGFASPNLNNPSITDSNFDTSILDGFLPYRKDESLPEAIIKTNKRGNRYVEKQAEPRFYFFGNEFRRVQIGLGGKKTSLFWTYKGDAPNPIKSDMSNDVRPLHRQIRSYLRKKGIPGA